MNQNNYELYHFGVKGMKWGVRRQSRKIEQNNRAREAINKSYDRTIEKSQKRFDASIAKQQKRFDASIAKQQKRFDASIVKQQKRKDFSKLRLEEEKKMFNTRVDYANAKRQARIDKNYAKTDEYKQKRNAYARDITQNYIYGKSGTQTIRALERQGVSGIKARGALIARNALTALSIKH